MYLNSIYIVLLSGGSGTRLWPLSNDSRSKQFLKVLRDECGNHVSMVQRTFAQIERTIPQADITVATCASQERILRLQVGADCKVVVEPERRDTAPAIMLACEHLHSVQGIDNDDVVIVLPIDSYVDDSYFDRIVDVAAAVKNNVADICLLGAEPTYPSEKYGYIVPSSSTGSPRLVERFIEKPDSGTAADLISKGALWNNCVFGFKLGYVLNIINNYGSYQDFADLRARYSELPINSFDYEVVENADSIAVVPYSGPWADLGTWNTLSAEMADRKSGHTVLDSSTCENTHVINELDIPLIVSGINDAVVVATVDGILVCSKEQSPRLKELVSLI